MNRPLSPRTNPTVKIKTRLESARRQDPPSARRELNLNSNLKFQLNHVKQQMQKLDQETAERELARTYKNKLVPQRNIISENYINNLQKQANEFKRNPENQQSLISTYQARPHDDRNDNNIFTRSLNSKNRGISSASRFNSQEENKQPDSHLRGTENSSFLQEVQLDTTNEQQLQMMRT